MKNLIHYLTLLGKNQITPINLDEGICEEVRIYSSLNLQPFFISWPLYSGNSGFPVPHPNMGSSTAFHCVENLWRDNEYGDNRRSLCLHIAKCLKKQKFWELGIVSCINWSPLSAKSLLGAKREVSGFDENVFIADKELKILAARHEGKWRNYK